MQCMDGTATLISPVVSLIHDIGNRVMVLSISFFLWIRVLGVKISKFSFVAASATLGNFFYEHIEQIM